MIVLNSKQIHALLTKPVHENSLAHSQPPWQLMGNQSPSEKTEEMEDCITKISLMRNGEGL